MSLPAAAPAEAGALAFARALAREMPGRMAAAVALTLAVTAAEAAGLLLLVELLALVGLSVPDASTGAFGRLAREGFAALGVAPTLGAVLLAYVGVMAGQAALQRAQSIVAYRVELEAALRMRTRLYEAVARARWLALARLRSTDLVHALAQECDRIGHAASYLLSMAVQGLVGAVYLAAAVRVSPAVSAVALGCGAALLLGLRRFRHAARDAGRRQTVAMADVVATAGEHLQGMKLVKSYGAEGRSVGFFAAAAREATDAFDRANRAYADARAGYTAGSVALLAVVAFLALEVLDVPGSAVLLLVFLFSRLVPRLGNLQQIWQHFVHDLPAYANVSARVAALEAERESAPEAAPAPEPVPLREALRLEDVSFAYGAPGGGDAVRGLTLEVPANATTALVGPSGAGKSTVADLVMGLVAPRTGAVTVDGRALEAGWLGAWRAGIGYVAQETLLFHDTVRANLRWARPDATDDELLEALRLAAADGFVAALPEGLDTVVGDRGLRLSGGERQRLALARALLRRPSLLILDEATSALDTENERRIRDAIRALHGRVTILLITHRLGSVRDADRIHVLEGGRLAESGTFDELLARPGRFRALWASREAPAPVTAEPPPR